MIASLLRVNVKVSCANLTSKNPMRWVSSVIPFHHEISTELFQFPPTATSPVKVCEQCSQLVPSWELTFYGFVWMPVRHIQRWLWQQVVHWMEWKKRWVSWKVFPPSPKLESPVELQSSSDPYIVFFFGMCYSTPPTHPKKKLTNLSFDMEKERPFIFPPGAKKLERSTKRFGTRKVETRVARVARTSVSLTSQRSLTLAMVTKKLG